MTATLTPVLTARWDDPDSFTWAATAGQAATGRWPARWLCRPAISPP
jgi:hypothetical protein